LHWQISFCNCNIIIKSLGGILGRIREVSICFVTSAEYAKSLTILRGSLGNISKALTMAPNSVCWAEGKLSFTQNCPSKIRAAFPDWAEPSLNTVWVFGIG
jgi:hypothetical protein